MWLHVLIFFGGMIAGAFIGATVGVVAFGALLAARKSEVPETQELPHLPTMTTLEWYERDHELRQQ